MCTSAFSREPLRMTVLEDLSHPLVVGIADAIPAADRARPRVTVLDIDYPSVAAFHIAQDLVDRRLTRALVVHTEAPHDRVLLAALVAGASAVVAKDEDDVRLEEAVECAQRGRHVRPRVSVDGLVEAAGMVAPNDRAILGMLVHATPADEIGQVLGVHERELASRRRRMLNALLD